MTIEASERVIFISHTVADLAIAEAIQDALETLFGARAVTVAYSSSRELGSGVRFGEDWFQWIGQQVRTAAVTLVLLTPASVQKPWVLWEAGAVYGAALTDPDGALRRVRPIAFQVAMDDVPSPLQSSHAHIARGDNYSDVKLILNEFVEEFSTSNAATIRAAQNVPAATEHWLLAVAEALRTAPLSQTEPVVNEWCTRLDELNASNRSSEVGQLHEWLLIAFGQERGADQAIDIRIDRRLAQPYMSGGNYVEAAAQFNLARRISPRDLFVLRSLGQAYLSSRDLTAAEKVISDISRLDPDAFVQNPECAALKGRWLREQDRIREAETVYAAALGANPHSLLPSRPPRHDSSPIGKTRTRCRGLPQSACNNRQARGTEHMGQCHSRDICDRQWRRHEGDGLSDCDPNGETY
jgi:tetratricopeptide (TPR) repeat protein